MAIYEDGKHNENMEHVPKKNYEFYVDRKITDWVRVYHQVEADSLEDAKKKMIDAFHTNMCRETYDYQDGLNVVDFMEPGENGGNATAELYTENGDLLITNID
jgi:hypothetical protein